MPPLGKTSFLFKYTPSQKKLDVQESKLKVIKFLALVQNGRKSIKPPKGKKGIHPKTSAAILQRETTFADKKMLP